MYASRIAPAGLGSIFRRPRPPGGVRHFFPLREIACAAGVRLALSARFFVAAVETRLHVSTSTHAALTRIGLETFNLGAESYHKKQNPATSRHCRSSRIRAYSASHGRTSPWLRKGTG